MGDTDFDTWLSEKFRALNTDETVFVPYIKSIVEGDETNEEKIEALDGIIEELAETAGSLDVKAFREEILVRWEQMQKKISESLLANHDGGCSGIDSKLETLLKLNAEEETKTTKNLEGGAPDSALRKAILNQYQDSSDAGSDDEGPSKSNSGGSAATGARGGGVSGFERNTNVERVQNDLKEKREREKSDAAKKREKDKEDRAKQKQQAQERKDKAKKKAAKVERKR